MEMSVTLKLVRTFIIMIILLFYFSEILFELIEIKWYFLWRWMLPSSFNRTLITFYQTMFAAYNLIFKLKEWYCWNIWYILIGSVDAGKMLGYITSLVLELGKLQPLQPLQQNSSETCLIVHRILNNPVFLLYRRTSAGKT